jgi:hypothetical protein
MEPAESATAAQALNVVDTYANQGRLDLEEGGGGRKGHQQGEYDKESQDHGGVPFRGEYATPGSSEHSTKVMPIV